nr:hypothetical protein [Escherichia coli]
MNRDSFYPAIACFSLLLMLAGCAPMHETRQALSQQTPAAQVCKFTEILQLPPDK